MKFLNKLKIFFTKKREININELPSQGIFYKSDFKIFIKKATMADIIEYEHNFISDVNSSVSRIKKIIQKNVILSSGYTFFDIKSTDIIFIFLEIVRLTTGKEINVKYENGVGGFGEIDFCSKNFKYFDISKYMDIFDRDKRQFVIDGYGFSIPSIGIENDLVSFIMSRNAADVEKYNEINYNFMYFLGDRNRLEHNEIENLIEIFNYEVDDADKDIVSNIVNTFSGFVRYDLVSPTDNKVASIGKLDLMKIWK